MGKKHVRVAFIDTQVFDAYAHNYSSPHFKTLEELVKDQAVTVLLTDVTTREVRAHLAAKVAKAQEKVTALARDQLLKRIRRPPFDTITKEHDWSAVEQDAFKLFEQLCTSIEAKLVCVSEVDPETIFAAYFNQEPPFRTEKKKFEFPDAFAAEALRQWTLKQKARVHVISDDPDWKGICANVEEFEHYSTLPQFLELFPDSRLVRVLKDAINKQKAELDKIVTAQFEDSGFTLLEPEGDIDAVRVNWVDLGHMRVTKASGGSAEIEIGYTILYEADYSCKEPGTGYYDKEEDRVMCAEEESGTLEQEEEIATHVTIRYDKDDPGRIQFVTVKMPDDYAVVYDSCNVQ